MKMEGFGHLSWCRTPTATQQGPLAWNLDILIATRHLTFLILHKGDDDTDILQNIEKKLYKFYEFCNSYLILLRCVSISRTYPEELVGWSIRWLLILSDFHCVGVSGLSQTSYIFWKLWPTAFRRWFTKRIFPKCIFPKCTRLTHLLSFASLFNVDRSTFVTSLLSSKAFRVNFKRERQGPLMLDTFLIIG